MIFFTATFALLLAGIYALPQDEVSLSNVQERLITNSIRRVVEQINERVRDAGLDPVQVDHSSTQIITPIGGVSAWITGLKCSGISRNRFNWLDYSALTSRLRVDFVWDRIACETESVGLRIALLGREWSILQSGILEILRLRVQGDLQFFIRPISGISLRRCTLDLTADIKSDLTIKKLDRDLSDQVNWAVDTLNELFRANRAVIGEQLCELVGSLL